MQVLPRITNNSIKHQSLVYTVKWSNSSLFNNWIYHVICLHTVQMSNSSISPIDRTLSGATTPGQSGPGSNSNEGVLCIPQSSSITGVSLSDCLVSYPGHLLRESYPFAEMQLVYSTYLLYSSNRLWPPPTPWGHLVGGYG